MKHGEENGGDVVEKMLLVIPLLRDVLHYGIDEIKNRQLLIGGDLNDEHFVSKLHLQGNHADKLQPYFGHLLCSIT